MLKKGNLEDFHESLIFNEKKLCHEFCKMEEGEARKTKKESHNGNCFRYIFLHLIYIDFFAACKTKLFSSKDIMECAQSVR